jgi:putative hydrolase of the HAD superfamily
MSAMHNPSGDFRAILFDVGGVLLTNGWDHVERAAVYKHFDLTPEAIAAIEARHPHPYDVLERDEISFDDYLNTVVFFEPRAFTPDDFIEVVKPQSKKLTDSALGVLGEVAASGKWVVGLLNNESRTLHEYRVRHFGLARHLDLQLSSCYVGLRKPEPAIYRRALDILGCKPSDVIFIDDRAGNADAAAAEGIRAIQYRGEAPLRLQLHELGIL